MANKDMTKPFWQSTTLWINALGVLAVVLPLVLQLKLVVDPDAVAIILAVINIINRLRPVEKKNLTLN